MLPTLFPSKVASHVFLCSACSILHSKSWSFHQMVPVLQCDVAVLHVTSNMVPWRRGFPQSLHFEVPSSYYLVLIAKLLGPIKHKSLSEDSSPGMWHYCITSASLCCGVVSPFFFSIRHLQPLWVWASSFLRLHDQTQGQLVLFHLKAQQYKSDLLDSWKWRQFDALQCQWTTCRELYSDLSVCISDLNIVITDILSVWPTATPGVVPRRRINWCQVPVTRRWQLASRRRLLKNRFSDWLQRYSREVMAHPPYSADIEPSDFHLFGPLKKHLAG